MKKLKADKKITSKDLVLVNRRLDDLDKRLSSFMRDCDHWFARGPGVLKLEDLARRMSKKT